MATELDDLYTRSPGVEKIGQPDQSTGGAQNSFAAQSTGFTAQTGQVKEEETASGRLSKITAQDSPLMQRAKQEGMLTAGRRGLQNSSIAAGAAQGAMVDRALPLAQQDASMFQQQNMANQEAINRASEVSTGRETDISKYNTAAQLDIAQANMQAENTMRSQVMQQNAEINKQYLAGTQAMDLATIQGQYNQLISTNETAARLYDSYFNSISQAMANKDLPPDRIAQYVNVQQSMLEAGLRMMDAMNTLNLDTALPGVYSSGSGTSSQIGVGEAPAPAPAPTGTTGGTTGSLSPFSSFLQRRGTA